MVYDPGTPFTYAVTGAKTEAEARVTVLRTIGYNPGVTIRCKAIGGSAPDHALVYRPLTPAEKDAVRFND